MCSGLFHIILHCHIGLHHVIQVSVSSSPFYFVFYTVCFILDSSFAIIQVLSGFGSISVS